METVFVCRMVRQTAGEQKGGCSPAPGPPLSFPMLCCCRLTPLSLPSWDLLEAGSTMALGPGTQEDLESIQPLSYVQHSACLACRTQFKCQYRFQGGPLTNIRWLPRSRHSIIPRHGSTHKKRRSRETSFPYLLLRTKDVFPGRLLSRQLPPYL